MQKKGLKIARELSEEFIESKIFILRGYKVMLDKDLAQLYNVETKQLKRAVKRNREKFPNDFMFVLSQKEHLSLRSHFGTLKRGRHTKYTPFAFTDYGILMLSSVLNSPRAVQVNIQIMRTFAKLRKMIKNNKELKEKIDNLERKYDHHFKVVFEAIRKLLDPEKTKTPSIGFHSNFKEKK